jgi:hypothetical protein
MSLLSDLKAFLKAHNLLNAEEPIWQISQSCCDSYKAVIDFDRIKDEFCKIIGISHIPPKSADCLYINIDKSELLFMEMKDLDQTIQDYKTASSLPLTDREIIEKMEQSFKKWKLDSKIIDSYMIILSIIGYYGFDKTFYSYYLDKNRLRIKYILLFNISNRDYIKYRIADSQYLNNINFRFLSKTDIVRAEDFDRLISLP